MKKYAIVITGGRIDEDFALRFVREAVSHGDPLLIAADRGLRFLEKYGIAANLVVGDFDSAGEDFISRYRAAHPDAEIRRFGWEKDYTDTELAVRAACEGGAERIDILGATGTRLDHVLGSIQVLAMLLEKGVSGRILDPNNRITMHDHSFRIRREDQWGKYVSFFSWGGAVHHLTLKGFHFLMENGCLTPDRTLAVSNQIEDETAEVTFESGMLLMIESKD